MVVKWPAYPDDADLLLYVLLSLALLLQVGPGRPLRPSQHLLSLLPGFNSGQTTPAVVPAHTPNIKRNFETGLPEPEPPFLAGAVLVFWLILKF